MEKRTTSTNNRDNGFHKFILKRQKKFMYKIIDKISNNFLESHVIVY